MFQGEALLPWRSARENVIAGLEFAGVARAEALERGREWMRRVGLGGFEERYPHQMSGGMRKRAMLAQTLIRDPDIILMDEPFSALDIQDRKSVGTGKSVSVRVDFGGRRHLKKKKQIKHNTTNNTKRK